MTWHVRVVDGSEDVLWSESGEDPLALLGAMVGFFRADGRRELVGWLENPDGFEKAYLPLESDAIMKLASSGRRTARWRAVVRHRGNSLAVTVPAETARELGLKDGDEVDVEVTAR